ncbi:uncharacterized protein LOC128545503 [Clarias gariepinus]|uniref:uncharacterized protein LOC128545503 n=1 Tax=Clarias gariepinus TaxID=13013 RepID=UPI00234CD644|nr:uncharacterized protein LOC128545503 [Clarias gariepinus]
MSIVANKGKRSECFLRFVALLLIHMQVVNSQGLPEISDMFVEFSYIDGQTNNLREKRDVNADILQYIIIIEVNVSQAIFFDQIKSSLESFSPFQVDNTTEIDSLNITTVCSLNGTEYQCSCEDQYFWPSEKCTLFVSCGNITNSSCGCINTLPNDGQFCQPFNDLLTEYLIFFEIDAVNVTVVNELRNILETHSLPFINTNINITEINVTTVCYLRVFEYQCLCQDHYLWTLEKCITYGSCYYQYEGACTCLNALPSDGQMCVPKSVCSLNGAEYHCWCQGQYFWPCEKCTLYGPCDNVTNTSCGCINALPNDGHFCQPANELTCMYEK